MKPYLARRLTQLLAVLFVVSVIVFTLVRLIPGDPASVQLGSEATPQALADLRRDMGLDRPLWIQYGLWVRNVLRGDLGQSWVSKQSPGALIRRFLPATLQLTALALVIALIPALLQVARTARAAEQTLVTVDHELKPLTSQVQALLQEHRTLAQQATRDLRQIEGVTVMAQDVLGRVTNLTSLLASFGTVGRVVGVARGLQKGIDVFVSRLVRHRGKE